MGLFDLEDIKAEEDYREAWWLGDYVGTPCPKCWRHRLCVCNNGKHRCEKCLWCPEEQRYVPDELHG